MANSNASPMLTKHYSSVMGTLMEDGLYYSSSVESSVFLEKQQRNLPGIRGFLQRNLFRSSDRHFRGARTFKLIHPKSRLYMIWISVIFIMLIYTAISVPLRISFDPKDNCQLSLFWGILDFVIDSFFVCDLIMHFFVCRVINGVLEDDRKKVWQHYLRNAFVLEFVKCLPISWLQLPMQLSNNCDRNMTGLPLLRIMRGLRVIRLTRLADFRKLVSAMSINSAFLRNPNMLNLVKMVIFMAFCVHCVACFWWFIKKDDPNLDEWLVEQNIGNWGDLSNYIVCAYYAIATLTTVGYGDVHATNDEERLAAIGCIFVGGLLFAAIISHVSTLFMSLVASSNIQEARKSDALAFMKSRNIPQDLQKRVLSFLDRFRTESNVYGTDVLDGLPASIKYDLLKTMATDTLTRVHIFKKLRPEVVMAIYTKLQPLRCAPTEVLVEQGTENNCMYFVLQGTLTVIEDGVEVDSVEEGDAYGAYFAFSDVSIVHHATVMTIDFAELFSLTKEDLMDALSNFPGYYEMLKQRVVMFHKFKRRLAATKLKKRPRLAVVAKQIIKDLREKRLSKSKSTKILPILNLNSNGNIMSRRKSSTPKTPPTSLTSREIEMLPTHFEFQKPPRSMDINTAMKSTAENDVTYLVPGMINDSINNLNSITTKHDHHNIRDDDEYRHEFDKSIEDLVSPSNHLDSDSSSPLNHNHNGIGNDRIFSDANNEDGTSSEDDIIQKDHQKKHEELHNSANQIPSGHPQRLPSLNTLFRTASFNKGMNGRSKRPTFVNVPGFDSGRDSDSSTMVEGTSTKERLQQLNEEGMTLLKRLTMLQMEFEYSNETSLPSKTLQETKHLIDNLRNGINQLTI